MLIVNWLAHYLQHLQDHGLYSGGKELGNVALASVGEGAFMCTSKDPIVTESNWAASPVISTTLLVSALQMPSFNPEQKLLSGLIYNPDLLTGP